MLLGRGKENGNSEGVSDELDAFSERVHRTLLLSKSVFVEL
jgi:hypothetical protein